MEKRRFLDESFKSFDSCVVEQVDDETLKQIAEDYKKYDVENKGIEFVAQAIEKAIEKENYGNSEEM